jgi:predicted nucleic acid-binding protein
MRILLDINVVLDVLLDRHPFANDAEAIWQAAEDGRVEALIASTTLTTIYFLTERLRQDRQAARDAVEACLDSFRICAVDETLLRRAFALNGRDFEDDVQIACAVDAAADFIVTRDGGGGFAASPVPVLAPAQLLPRLP